MARYLVDANLPYRFALWAGDDCIHARDLDQRWSDSRLWAYAREHALVIVSKDADFSDRVLLSQPPPRVVHIRYGNMKIRDFYQLIRRQWPTITELSATNRLVRVYDDSIEAIE